jgi:hypothetical protein
MNTTTVQLAHAPPKSATPRSIAARQRGSESPEGPTLRETLDETAPLIGAHTIYGPPLIFVLGPWLLVGLLVIPPAAFLITLVLVAVVAAGLVVALVGLASLPYLLVRRLRARHAARRSAFVDVSAGATP